jgi:hypothetical protein
MHSSLGVSEIMPFGQSCAGLESLSVYRACVMQRMRTLSRAQNVASTIIFWRSTRSVGGNCSAQQRRDDIGLNQNGDAIAGLDRVGAL